MKITTPVVNRHIRSLFLVGAYLLGLTGILATGGGGGGSDSSSDSNTGTASITFPAQAQNVDFVAGVPQEFVTANTFDVAALGGPFESVTIDATAMLNNLAVAVMRAAQSNLAFKTDTIAPDTPDVGNCFPFGMGPLGNPGTTNPWGPFGGFVYQNVPAFDLQVGDGLAFDLGAPNDVDIGLDIYMAPTTTNGGTVEAGAFTKVVSNTQAPTTPRGDNVVGNFELGFMVESAFSFPGGGLIIRFGSPSPTFNTDTTCTQVLVHGDPSDTSGYFVERFIADSDGVSPWDIEFADTIGAFRVGTGALTTGATVQIYTGLAEEQDDLCNTGSQYYSLSVLLNGLNQAAAVQPTTFTASQELLDIYNTGSVATCTRVTTSVNAVASMSGLEAEYQTCTKPPADFDGTWSGTYSCTGSCPDPGGPITLTVNQNGGEATYSDGFASYSGFVCGDVFSFTGGNSMYEESGKLTLTTGPNSATKTSFFRESPTCSGRCTDFLTRP